MKADNPIKGFSIDRDALEFVGEDLQRPECILAERDGNLWAADSRGGVVLLKPDGSQKVITQKYAQGVNQVEEDVMRFFEGTLPNGLAFAKNGDFLIANFGTDCLEIMKRTGETDILVDKIDGKEIGKVNFVLRDSKDRLWITITTRKKNWIDALVPDLYDGYIARYDERGLCVVAENLQFTNEVRMDAKEEYLYVVQTTGGNVLRYKVTDDGELTNREIFGPTHMGAGAYPDGIAFDTYGNLWGTMVYSDKLFVITPDGEMVILLDEGDKEIVANLDKAFNESRVTYDLLFATGRGVAPWMASVTFGGPDLQTLYIGSLRGSNIPYFRAPVAGLPMVHWNDTY